MYSQTRELRDFRRQRQQEVRDVDDETIRATSEESSTLRGTSMSTNSISSNSANSHSSWTASVGNSFLEEGSARSQSEESEDTSRSTQIETSFIIATDFGTTFSSVAFCKCENGRPGRIESIKDYPDDQRPGNQDSVQVPTESWYTGQEIQRAVQSYSAEKGLRDLGLDDDDEYYNFSDDDAVSRTTEQMSNDTVDTEDFFSRHEEMTDMDLDMMMEDEILEPFIWGYGVHNRLASSDLNQATFKRIARSKLLLDTSPRTKQIRDQLKPTLNKLKDLRIITNDEDVIVDYLMVLFRHTKWCLSEFHGLFDGSLVEHVLCVPNVWSAQSSRKMQTAMETAIQLSGLGSIENLFIVSEPEAGASYILKNNNEIHLREAFLIIDAGGGTVDLTTYKVRSRHPLRLMQEAVEPDGGLFGSSYINEGFRQKLMEKIKGETYLETRGITIEGIVDAATLYFENVTKRSFDITGPIRPIDSKVWVQGLEANIEKRFVNNRAMFSWNDYQSIYMPVLDGITTLMKSQLDKARTAGVQVRKVVLIGGFAASPSLRNHLSRKLKEISINFRYNIKLVSSGAPETAVAFGAVLSALHKEGGPHRILRSSYGFLRTEPHEPSVCPAHDGTRPSIDKLDGNRYVRNTIDWLVKKGGEVKTHDKYSLSVCHTFSLTKKRLICEELLYVSDTSTESHYRRGHPKNKGAELAGSILMDMTFLRTEGIIQPTVPQPGERSKPHYKVEFELVMIINGRNLRYEARWPAGGEVRGSGQISIAAAFLPGTD